MTKGRTIPEQKITPSPEEGMDERRLNDIAGADDYEAGAEEIHADLETDEGAFTDEPEALAIMVEDDLDETNLAQPADPFDRIAVGKSERAFHGELPPHRSQDDLVGPEDESREDLGGEPSAAQKDKDALARS